ncbi:MAG: Nif11-like leader peptide family natural product precursor [Chlorobiaceae bacterium]
MALEQAKRFIHHLESDEELRYRFEAFIVNEGYSFTLNEIMIAECEELKERRTSLGYSRKPFNLCGYENWVG